MDIVLGRFVDAYVAILSEQEVDGLEALMEMPDPNFIFGSPAPPGCRKHLIRRYFVRSSRSIKMARNNSQLPGDIVVIIGCIII